MGQDDYRRFVDLQKLAEKAKRKTENKTKLINRTKLEQHKSLESAAVIDLRNAAKKGKEGGNGSGTGLTSPDHQ